MQKTPAILVKSLSSITDINHLRHFHFPALPAATLEKLFWYFFLFLRNYFTAKEIKNDNKSHHLVPARTCSSNCSNNLTLGHFLGNWWPAASTPCSLASSHQPSQSINPHKKEKKKRKTKTHESLPGCVAELWKFSSTTDTDWLHKSPENLDQGNRSHTALPWMVTPMQKKSLIVI